MYNADDALLCRISLSIVHASIHWSDYDWFNWQSKAVNFCIMGRNFSSVFHSNWIETRIGFSVTSSNKMINSIINSSVCNYPINRIRFVSRKFLPRLLQLGTFPNMHWLWPVRVLVFVYLFLRKKNPHRLTIWYCDVVGILLHKDVELPPIKTSVASLIVTALKKNNTHTRIHTHTRTRTFQNNIKIE